MRTRQALFAIFLLFSFVGCRKNKIPDEQIISDILPQFIDSLGINRSNLIPPPPPPIYDKDSNFIAIDSIAANKILQKHKKHLKQIDSIDSRLLIGLVDSTLVIDYTDLQKRRFIDNKLIKNIIENNSGIEKPKVKWNLDLIKTPIGYQLRFKSDLNKKYSDVWSIKDRKFGGIIAFSGIYLDNENHTGLLKFNFHPFFFDRSSYYVVIEKVDKKWRIKRILLNWIT